jgi:hypothetical protein
MVESEYFGTSKNVFDCMHKTAVKAIAGSLNNVDKSVEVTKLK